MASDVNELELAPVAVPDPMAETAVDVDLSAEHLLNIKGTALRLEYGVHLPYDFSVAQIIEGVVSILDDDDVVIGHGLLKVEGNELVLEGALDYATPARLSLQNGDKLFLHFVGKVEVIGAPKGMLERITKIQGSSVVLSTQRPLDYKVDSVVVTA